MTTLLTGYQQLKFGDVWSPTNRLTRTSVISTPSTQCYTFPSIFL